MPKPKTGLRVKYCENVAQFDGGKVNKGSCRLLRAWPDGWYIQVKFGGRWHPLTDLLFAREKDAFRAAVSLTAAGLDSYSAMNRADPMTVKATACEHLQW